jgi:ribosome-associated toxin RatA of RatAB toxin-antitoxin module
MADPLSITAGVIASLQVATKVYEDVLRSRDQLEDFRQIQLDVQVTHHKFQLWQQTWSGQTHDADVSGRAL